MSDNTVTDEIILQVAVPLPVYHHFDYLPPPDFSALSLKPGVRIKVPWRKKEIMGVLLGCVTRTDISTSQLKHAVTILDDEPLLSNAILELAQFAADYYRCPHGEVLFAGLPSSLRKVKSPKKRKTRDVITVPAISPGPISKPLDLSTEQQHAVTSVLNMLQQFQCFLLDGVTGSGKTEVYLQIISQVLADNKQALILVPEIGLTPQTVTRFQQRFAVPIVLLHSGVTDKERSTAWLKAQQGDAKIIIGTRSAIFTPIPRLGIIIIDEEHDISFKQQEGFRYSARDLAVVRGHIQHIPVILGSATPSLESLYNVQQNRYQLLHLPERAGTAIHPEIHLIDLRKQPIKNGISAALLQIITRHLTNNGQVLLFLNRRGYAPTLICQACGQAVNCNRCDARMTLHLSPRSLQCHHCGFSRSVDQTCQHCSAARLVPLGLGTERVEEMLQKEFPNIGIVRIDRDTTRQRGSLDDKLSSVHSGEARILIGTQMLAKGHHFPEVTLVAILDADSGLYSADFRGSEKMAQIITQVAGRAGRADCPGEVYIQSYHPEHPLLQALLQDGYANFAATILAERKNAELPPYTYFALLRAEARNTQLAMQFLQKIRENILFSLPITLFLLGPVPAPMARRAGHHRAQLLIRAQKRQILQEFLPILIQQIQENKLSKKIRWSLDVDPLEMF